jgi:uncharacterized protein YegJ (DUF2314 family)
MNEMEPDSPEFNKWAADQFGQYYLTNVVDANRRYPDTFFIMPVEERTAIKVKDIVKLIFNFPDISERMWVIVTEVQGGQYFGIVDNDPVTKSGLIEYGSAVTFGPEHIASKHD